MMLEREGGKGKWRRRKARSEKGMEWREGWLDVEGGRREGCGGARVGGREGGRGREIGRE